MHITQIKTEERGDTREKIVWLRLSTFTLIPSIHWVFLIGLEVSAKYNYRESAETR